MLAPPAPVLGRHVLVGRRATRPTWHGRLQTAGAGRHGWWEVCRQAEWCGGGDEAGGDVDWRRCFPDWYRHPCRYVMLLLHSPFVGMVKLPSSSEVLNFLTQSLVWFNELVLLTSSPNRSSQHLYNLSLRRLPMMWRRGHSCHLPRFLGGVIGTAPTEADSSVQCHNHVEARHYTSPQPSPTLTHFHQFYRPVAANTQQAIIASLRRFPPQ